MRIESRIVKIKNNNTPTTEYIEKELNDQNINPIRWAIVEVSEEYYTISVATKIY